MIIRESRIGRMSFVVTALTWLLFAGLCGWLGDKVTSKQWTYLMSVPGHKWFWACAFGIGAVTALAGIAKRRHRVTAAGLFIVGTGCLLIFGFYLFAPLIDPGLFTLGFVVWFFAAVIVYTLAAFNLTAVTWF